MRCRYHSNASLLPSCSCSFSQQCHRIVLSTYWLISDALPQSYVASLRLHVPPPSCVGLCETALICLHASALETGPAFSLAWSQPALLWTPNTPCIRIDQPLLSRSRPQLASSPYHPKTFPSNLFLTMRERYGGRVTYRLDRTSSSIAVGGREVFVEFGSSQSRPLRTGARLLSVISLH